jgi:outer membrane protein TolC
VKLLARLLCSLVPAALLVASAAAAQTGEPRAGSSRLAAPGPLTVEEVVRSAAERYPLVLAALRDEDAAEGELLSARGGFDPAWRTGAAAAPFGGYRNWRAETVVEQPTPLWGTSVFAGYRISSERDTFPVYDQRLATNQLGEVRGGVRVPLLRDGPVDRRRAAIERARLGTDLAKLTVAQQRIEVVRAATHRYWDWVAAGRRLAIAREWAELANKRDSDIAERAQAGDIAEIDRKENRRTILQRRAAVIAAERLLIEAANELSLFLRDAQGKALVVDASRLPQSIPVTGAAAPANPSAAEAQALQHRPELARLGALREQARVERDLARNQRLPAIDVLVAGSKDFGPGDPRWDRPVLEAAVLIDVPLLARAAAGREQSQQSTMARLDWQQQLARDRIAADVRNAIVAVQTAKQRADLAAEELEVAEALEKAEMDRFYAGESTLLIVNLREQAAVEAGVRLVDGLADLHKAVATYRATLGTRN